jgi:hypothetical protein
MKITNYGAEGFNQECKVINQEPELLLKARANKL